MTLSDLRLALLAVMQNDTHDPATMALNVMCTISLHTQNAAIYRGEVYRVIASQKHSDGKGVNLILGEIQ